MPHSVGFGAELGLVMPATVAGERAPRLLPMGGVSALVPKVPPSIVVDPMGRVGGAERLERPDESPLIGSGIDWPLPATIMGGAGPLRVPLALMLAHLVSPAADTAGQRWRVSQGSWRTSGETTRLDRLIASYLVRATDRVQESGSLVSRAIFAVPNATPLPLMTQILNVTGSRARLIWRPVAALIAAISSQPQEFQNIREEDRVLVVHMGIDGFEATPLHVLRRTGAKGPELLVPGRPKQSPSTNVHRPLAGLLRWLRDRRVDAVDGDLAQAWARAWLCEITAGDDGLEAIDWLSGPWDQVERASGDGAWGWFSRQVANGRTAEAYRAEAAGFCKDVIEMVSGASRPRAVVFAGGFASLECELVQRIISASPRQCPVVRSTWGVGDGAALFGWREQMGWATYSDYLPQMDLCVERNGVPEWAAVVESDWIDAGTRYQNRQTGFKLRKPATGATDRRVELAVAMEGYEHVRMTQDLVRFPDEARADDVPLTIEIDVQAASGEPRVTAIPDGDIAPVVLDWGIAASSERTREEYLAALPRSFPPHESVRAARWWYQPVQYRTISLREQPVPPKQYVESVILPGIRRGAIDRESLGEIRKHVIRRTWNREDLVWEALVSSEGQAQLHQNVLDELQACLFSWLQANVDPGNKEHRATRRDVIKVLAWSSFKSSAFEQLIARRIKSEKDWIHAVGNAIRSPRYGAVVMKQLGSLLSDQVLATPRGDEISKINDPLKQLSWLMALRTGITSDMPSDAVESIAEAAFECAMNLEQHGNLAVKFRWAVRCMLLCLMHRQHDPEFLDPVSDLARKMLRFCGKLYLRIGPPDEFARRIAKDLRLGVDSLRRESKPTVARDLQTFIEYLERRGSGSIIVESEEDDD